MISYSIDHTQLLTPGVHALSAFFQPTDRASFSKAMAQNSVTVMLAPEIVWEIKASEAEQAEQGRGKEGGQLEPGQGQGQGQGGGSGGASAAQNSTPTMPTCRFGNPLTERELCASLSLSYPPAFFPSEDAIPGSFLYDPPLGAVLDTTGVFDLKVTFIPDSCVSHIYHTVTKIIQIECIPKATASLHWVPDVLPYGTPIGYDNALTAKSDIEGRWEYTGVVIGTRLDTGKHIISADFYPLDTWLYQPSSVIQNVTVTRCSVRLSVGPFDALTYGQRLEKGVHFTAAITSPPVGGDLSPEGVSADSSFGTFSYSHSPLTLLRAGAHTLTVTFTPTDLVNYGPCSLDVPITVRRHEPLLTWKSPNPILYGTRLTDVQLCCSVEDNPHLLAYNDAMCAGAGVVGGGGRSGSIGSSSASTLTAPISSNIPGTLTYSPELNHRFPHVGRHQLKVRFVPSDTANYSTADKMIEISVRRAAPKIIWPKPEQIFEGTRLSATQLNATLDFPEFGPHFGKWVYDPAVDAKLELGLHILRVSFVPVEAEKDNFDGSKGNFSAQAEQLVAPLRGVGKKR